MNIDYAKIRSIIELNKMDQQTMNIFHNEYSMEHYMTENYDDELVQLLRERSDKNEPYPLLHLALMYLLGLGLEKDLGKGTDLLKKSMDVGCSQAYYFMAMFVLIKQIECEMNYEELLNIAMKMKNSSAFVYKGLEYSETNIKKSIQFFKEAIKLDNYYAMYRLGELYHDNNKYKLAIKYYKQAMDKGVDHAYFNLAIMYREGEGVDVNLVQAKKLFKDAMKMGNIRAITCIGGLHEENGNIEKAKKYYKLAIEKDDTFAKYNLALIYANEDEHKKAIQCFIASAKDGHEASNHKLIYDYNVMSLEMTDKDIDELLNWHQAFKNFGAYDGFLSR